MQVRVLGPVEVVGPAGVVPIRRAKERAVLALLALHVNRAVADDQLVDALWGDDPPPSAVKTLRSYISRLRATLGAGPLTIETVPAGHRLAGPADAVDVAHAERLAAEAREAQCTGDAAWAAMALDEAARLFQGTPLAEFAHEPWARGEVARLEELQLAVVEARIEADLACGRHDAVVGELEALSLARPLRERVWGLRMLALARCGRQAEALRVYDTLRERLVEELGIDPSPELKALQRSVLDQDALVTGRPSAAAPAPHELLPAGLVTLLLTDIEGSTRLWEAMPGAMAEALHRHDALVAAAVAAAGGRAIKSKGEGDSTLSVFAKATDAALAAVALQRALRAEPWPAGIAIAVRMALHTGEAEVRDGDYYGRTLNRAARLRALADGGRILCSRATADLVADALPPGAHLVDLGEFELRDIERAEHVFAIAHPDFGDDLEHAVRRGGVARVPWPPALRVGSDQPFVGRRLERKRIGMAWDGAARGQGRVALIAGEPGIGKTRLAVEIARGCFDEGATVLHGRCDEDLGVAYQPFIEALRPYVAHCAGNVLRAHVAEHGGALVPALPELLQRVQPPAAGFSDPEGDRLRLFDATAGLLNAAAEQNPVVLVLDDLHWATKPTLLLLRHVVRHVGSARLLVLATYRDTEVGRRHPLTDCLADLRTIAGVERFPLGGLETEDIAEMLARWSEQDADEATRNFAAALRTETQGNPFFVHEVCQHLVETGAVTKLDGIWKVQGEPGGLGLPEGVRDVVGRRLSRLSDTANAALTVAAVMGEEFDAAVVEHVSGRPRGGLLDEFDEALIAGIVAEVPSAAGRLRFSHSLIRQTLYDELTTARRVRLHRQVGEAIEHVHGSRLDLHLGALAHHFCEAALDAQATKAAAYALRAAQHSFDQFAYEETLRFVGSGLSVLELDVAAGERTRFDLLLLATQVHARILDVATARKTGLAAAEAAEALGDVRGLADAMCLVALTLGMDVVTETDPEVTALYERALAAIGPTDDGLRARVMGAFSRYLASTFEETFDLAMTALELARRAGDTEAVCWALSAAAASAQVDQPEVLIEHCDELIALARRTGLVDLEADGRLWRVGAHLLFADMDGFRREVDNLAALARRTRSVRAEALRMQVEPTIALIAGEFVRAETMLTESAGFRDTPAWTITMMGHWACLRKEQGRLAELGIAEFAIEDADFPIPLVSVLRAYSLAELGDHKRAREAFANMTRDALDRWPRKLVWEGGLCVYAEICAQLGDGDVARRLYDELAPRPGRIPNLAGLIWGGSADRHLGMLAAVLGDYDRAGAHFEDALEIESRLPSPPMVARTGYWYARMLVARAGRDDRERAATLLANCRATAQELGMAMLDRQAAEVEATLA